MKKIVLTPEMEEYPKRLLEIEKYPEKLYAVGNISLLNKTSIAIVGARKCDNYGIEQTKKFASYISKNGITVISGLASGIDSIAHYYSKENEGKTIAVIASGFNNIYPPENKKLFNEIIEEGGLVISEWDEDVEIDMHRFPKRNRIISGLSSGVLVIEARYRSGTTITAHFANKQNKDIFCIPNNIESPLGYGTNKLIQEGANLVMSPQEIIDYLEPEKDTTKTYDDIYELIGITPISANEIAIQLNKEIDEINERLLILELDGYIKKKAGGKYIKNFYEK